MLDNPKKKQMKQIFKKIKWLYTLYFVRFSEERAEVCVNCNDQEQSAGSEYCGECIDNMIH